MENDLKQRLSDIERKQSEIEKLVASGVQSGVGNHCSFLQWHKLQVEYYSLYKLLENR